MCVGVGFAVCVCVRGETMNRQPPRTHHSDNETMERIRIIGTGIGIGAARPAAMHCNPEHGTAIDRRAERFVDSTLSLLWVAGGRRSTSTSISSRLHAMEAGGREGAAHARRCTAQCVQHSWSGADLCDPVLPVVSCCCARSHAVWYVLPTCSWNPESRPLIVNA